MKPRRTIRSTSADIQIVSTADRYRTLARDLPRSDDHALEIGCASGEATRQLAETGAQVLAVDLSTNITDKVAADLADFPNVTVACIDGRNISTLAEHMAAPDIIFIDIGGDALLDNIAFQVRQCLRAFKPRTIIIRNFELAALSSCITDVEPPRESSLQNLSVHTKLGPTFDTLLDLSNSSNAKNRAFAARKLRSLGTPEAQQRLEEMRHDSDKRVRRIAERNAKGKIKK